MRPLTPITAAGLAAVTALAAGPAWATPVSLDDAIQAAVGYNPQARSQKAAVDAAEADRASGRARFLPLLRVEGNVQVWDSPTEVSLAGGATITGLPAPTTPYEAVVAGLLDGLSTPTRIRDQVTAQLTATVVQPLTPLLFMDDTHTLLDLGVESARIGVDSARRDAALSAAKGYIAVRLSMALESSARTQMAELDAQLARLDALVQGGVARESDQLRLQVARAAAQQDVIAAAARVRLAQAALATAMGVDAGQPVETAALPDFTCVAEATALTELQSRALQQRTELATLRTGAQQASLAASVKEMDLWPSLNAMISYTHVEGQSLADKDQGFIGLAFQWNAFEWGASSEAVAASRARARQVSEQMALVEDGVRLQVQQAQLDLQTIADSLQVAALAEHQAAESLRIESARYTAGAATATDVVTAESALREARDRRLAAEHQCLLANATLRAAVGDPITSATIITSTDKGAPR
ncbi:MAG: TolC family protein [Deltaproteobacteria bacterium]|nr:MAG: TolC family protein [Deltaproteobacteria bacterium]